MILPGMAGFGARPASRVEGLTLDAGPTGMETQQRVLIVPDEPTPDPSPFQGVPLRDRLLAALQPVPGRFSSSAPQFPRRPAHWQVFVICRASGLQLH